MYEINLVPDIKAELLRSQKLRNLIISICILLGIVCAGVIFILFGIHAGQGIALISQDKEIECRADGAGSCSKNDGIPLLKFKNGNEYLTIQDQMKNISLLNSNKLKFSRVFGVLDVVLPDDQQNQVKISELSADFANMSLFFDANAYAQNKINYSTLEVFRKNAKRAYYDYGDYMRYDKDSNNYVPIPAFCVDEQTDAQGITYGFYHKGRPGCEAPVISDEQGKTEDEKKQAKEGETIIKIRRSYLGTKDREDYKNGSDRLKELAQVKMAAGDNTGEKQKEGEIVKGYYFNSKCLQYSNDQDGRIDEAATLAACPLLAEEPKISGASLGINSEDELVLRFSAKLMLKKEVFLAENKHVQVVGPTRRNVTDSYVQIRDMFTEKAKDNTAGDDKAKTKEGGK